MDIDKARELALRALACVEVGEPESVADTTVLYKNEDGTYSVVDNGEEAVANDAEEAIRFIIENLIASDD